jgi:predicted HTH transcriptional regulator
VTLFGYLENPEEAQRVAAILSAYQFDELNPRQQLAVSYLATHRRITNSAFQLLCPDVHTETLRRDLSDMVSRGVLIKIGEKRATYYILK